MASSLNKVQLIGNLGEDPKISVMNSGDKAATFSLATSEKWKDKNTGEPRERTEWHRVVIYNQGLIKVVETYVKKGSKLYVEGQLGTRKYNDAAGTEKYITEIVLRAFGGEIVLLGDPGGRRAAEPDAYGTTRTPAARGASAGSVASGGADYPSRRPADFDDDIPF